MVTVLVVQTRTCPVGGGRIIKHPPHYYFFLFGYALCKCHFGTMLGGVFLSCKTTYGGVHIGIVLIIHHFFERHFATGFSKKILMSSVKKIFRPMHNPQPFSKTDKCNLGITLAKYLSRVVFFVDIVVLNQRKLSQTLHCPF